MKLGYLYVVALMITAGCNEDFADPSESPRLPGFRDASVIPPNPLSGEQDEQSPAAAQWGQPANSSNERAAATGSDDTQQNAANAPTGNDGGEIEANGTSDSDRTQSDVNRANPIHRTWTRPTPTKIHQAAKSSSPSPDNPATPSTDSDNDNEPNDEQQESDLVSEIQNDLDASCVSAGCHATQNNLRSMEDVESLIGELPYNSGTPYIVPGNKEGSYLYNVLLAPNERTVAVNGAQMPPPYRPASLRRSPLQLRTLRENIGRWIDGLEP